MSDTRTMPGEYYPGGRTLAKAGTAAPQAEVTWEAVSGKPAVADIEAVGERYLLKDVKEKVNAIIAAFKGAAKGTEGNE